MKEELKSVVAEYLALEPGAVPEAFRFSGDRFQGSVGMYRFQAFAQKRLGRRLPAIPYGAGLDEAAALLGGAPLPERSAPDAVPAPRAAPVAAPGSESPSSGVGIDIEAVASMPSTHDFRGHEFYQSAFSAAEMAYCILKPEPRVHFCGLFSAKECLKKAAPEYLALSFLQIEVGHLPSGRPYYLRAGSADRPPFSLSISHTGEHAVAIALRQAKEPPPIAPAPAPSEEIEALRKALAATENSLRRLARGMIVLGAVTAALAACCWFLAFR